LIQSGHVRYHPALRDLLEPIERVTPHPDNPSNGDEEEIEGSIEANGMYRPVEAQLSTGHILAGNTTYAACLSLGASEIPVIWLDVDDETALRILIGDNEIARKAWVDPGLLNPHLELLQRTAKGLVGTGFRVPPPRQTPLNPGHHVSAYLTGDLMVSWFDVPGDSDRERLAWLLRQWLGER